MVLDSERTLGRTDDIDTNGASQVTRRRSQRGVWTEPAEVGHDHPADGYAVAIVVS
jgi:hypothetical protein